MDRFQVIVPYLKTRKLVSYLRPHVDPMDDLTVDLLAEGQAWAGWIHDEFAREWLAKHLGPGA